MRTYGFAIAGTGMIAAFHARAIAATEGARLVAVCSRSKASAESFAKAHGCAGYDSLREVLARADVDVLVIATPSGAHLEAAVSAAHAGKHVLCEKPLEVDLRRVDQMIQAHAAAGTQLGCIFQIRYTPALEPIRQALREGRFGTLTYGGVYVPWWRSQGYYEDSSWHGTRALDGGGALMNQAIHMVDLLCDLMPPVASVSGVVSTVGHPKIETEDAASASLRFEGGAVGVVFGSTAAWPGFPKRLEISGTRGSVVLVDDRLTEFRFEDQKPEDEDIMRRFGYPSSTHGASNPAAMSDTLHAECFRDFVACLEQRRPFRVSGESARRSVALIQAIYESSASGQTVHMA